MHERREPRYTLIRLEALALAATLSAAGCAVGGPQIGPQTAAGYHTTTQFHFVSGDAVNGGTGYRETHQSQSHGGLLFGAKAGVAAASVGGVSAPAQQTIEIHFDGMYSIGRFGAGLSTSYGYELATVNHQDYSLTGLGLAAFGQFEITHSLFVNAGIGRLFLGNISRSQQAGDPISSNLGNDADVTPYRGFVGLTLIFHDSTTTQWGAAIELRATRTGDASIHGVNVQWSSASIVAELLCIKF